MTIAIADAAARLDGILARAERLVACVPAPYLAHRVAGTHLDVRDLAHRVFSVALAYVDGMDMGRLPDDWLERAPPDDLHDGAAVARYGALVRGRVGGWFEGAGPSELARVIETPEGPLSGDALLARATAMADTSLIALRAAVDDLGITPVEPRPANPRGRTPGTAA
jgi:hypothetical protein